MESFLTRYWFNDMKMFRTKTIVASLLLSLIILLVAEEARRTREFRTISERVRQESGINASLVLTLASDISNGADFGVLERAVRAAAARQQRAYGSLRAARPLTSFFPPSYPRILLTHVRSEFLQLQKISAIVAELQTLPLEQWSPKVDELRLATEIYSTAHRKIVASD